MKVRKAVIPCGGFGTRFLPITKAVPKELLPIIDTPVLSFIVDEAADSGIQEVLIILGTGKDSIKNYFLKNDALEQFLIEKNKPDLLGEVRAIGSRVKVSFAYQPVPLGSGDAILKAEEFACGEPFALAWGDDIIFSDKPVMAQLIDAYNASNSTVLGVQTVDTDDIVKYGVADVASSNDKLHRLNGIVEKPKLNEIPSRLAALGRYVVTPDVFDFVRKTKIAQNGELQLTDTFNLMCKNSTVFAYEFSGTRYDMGDKLGSLKAAVDVGIKKFGKDFTDFLNNILNK